MRQKQLLTKICSVKKQRSVLLLNVSFVLFTHVVEKRSAGSAKMVLPIQIKRIVVLTTSFEVRTFRGQTMALYLKMYFKHFNWDEQLFVIECMRWSSNNKNVNAKNCFKHKGNYAKSLKPNIT